MLLRIVWCLCLIGAVHAAAGCARSPTANPSGGYRTIAADPGRDTEAAQRYNQIGLERLADGKLDQAAEAFQKALTADVKFGPAHNNLGKVYFKQKAWYKAAWEFDYACTLLPKHAEPRNNLGLVLEASGELDRAVASYREAISLDPDHIAYQGNLVRALIRRGDRTDEVRNLLARILEQDTRSEWRDWARQEQRNLGFK